MSLECPYCKAELDDPEECYDADENYEYQCEYCEKYFIFNIHYSRHYFSQKTDCLNGAEHEYFFLRSHYDALTKAHIETLRCTMCYHEKRIGKSGG